MGKNIIVTGASKGIGFELVNVLTKAGHNVLALSRNIGPLDSIEINNLHVLATDITNDSHLKQVEAFVSNTWQQIDIIIHNAGKLISKPLAETTTNDFLEVFKVNVFAIAELTRLLLPHLVKGSHVVTISSMGGIQGSMKFPGLAAYSSSKGAVITLTELLAEEYKEQGISFNSLALGAVQTEMLAEAFPDYKAPTTANEMASYIAKFALTGNQFYNGKVLQVSATTP
jgi:NAD(P)-dependent dehydrogenase (short-subunit alcohol dehydrogenase family)